MCVTDRHDMTLAVKVALNPNTTNQMIHDTKQVIILIRDKKTILFVWKNLTETWGRIMF